MDTYGILKATAHNIRLSRDAKERWGKYCDAIEALEAGGSSVVQDLISALESSDLNVRLLAALFLGVLQDERRLMTPTMVSSATSAIIMSMLGPRGGEIGATAAGTALTLLGDSDAKENTRRFMKEFGIYDERKFQKDSMILVLNHIALH